MGYTSPSDIISFGVPQPDGTTKGYTFDNSGGGTRLTNPTPALPGATIGTNSWWPGLSAQTPGGTPNPVAAAAGLNWPSPGAVGVPPGTDVGGGSAVQDWFIRGAVFLLGLIFIGGGVTLFGRQG